MNKAPLWIAIAVTCAAVVGASIAATVHLTPLAQAPVAQSTPSPAPQPSELAPTPSTPPTPEPKLDDFPHQKITLRDETARDSEFAAFRERLKKAVQKREAQFVSSLIPSKGVALGFGAPQTLETLKLNDPKASFWGILEKALSSGCGRMNVESATTPDGWICPTVQRDFEKQYPPPRESKGIDYALSKVIVVGDRVNVRSKPSLNSPVIAVLSNEVVDFDRRSFQNSQEEQIEAYSPIEGWTPIILPNDQKGYVFNRYAYHPLENRVVFQKVKGQWQIVGVPGGD
ncbi:SH3 domain-containing protein [Phormidesmis priestleyi]